MSEIQANKLSPASGTALQVGDSGDTITIPSGATITNSGTATGFGMSSANTPLFMAYRSGSRQTVASSTWTKAQCNGEALDTDSAYDNSSNYRFTVPSGKAGKYYIFGQIGEYNASSVSISQIRSAIYKNGSLVDYSRTDLDTGGAEFHEVFANCSVILDLSVGDYVELYGKVVDSGTPEFTDNATKFGGYKLT